MKVYKNPALLINKDQIKPGKVAWRSPSNIAIIKYWGKHGVQLPQNPSISFTLTNAHTETSVSYEHSKTSNLELDFWFEGKQNQAFKDKIEKFLLSITDIFPFLPHLKLTIQSKNSFPHSAGIASSASAMSALALCLCSIERNLLGILKKEDDFMKKASYIARLGSGSACRSVYPIMAAWGAAEGQADTSDLYAIDCSDRVHEVFHTFHDDILFISKAEKSVSSRAGHALMNNSPYSTARYEQARARMTELMEALKTGNVVKFGEITENEALTLHALMMTSNPSYILMTAESLSAIEAVRAFRKKTGLPLYFSLDAGPNLHLLYPDSVRTEVQAFIKSDLAKYCEGGQWLADVVGKGATEL